MISCYMSIIVIVFEACTRYRLKSLEFVYYTYGTIFIDVGR